MEMERLVTLTEMEAKLNKIGRVLSISKMENPDMPYKQRFHVIFPKDLYYNQMRSISQFAYILRIEAAVMPDYSVTVQSVEIEMK
jgi:hypothetical protein